MRTGGEEFVMYVLQCFQARSDTVHLNIAKRTRQAQSRRDVSVHDEQDDRDRVANRFLLIRKTAGRHREETHLQ